MQTGLAACLGRGGLVLTGGAVGTRLHKEFLFAPDEHIACACNLYSTEGRRAIREIFGQYLQIAQEFDLPIMLMTNTRRANRDRVLASRYREHNVMRDYAELIRDVAQGYRCEMYLGGMLGCKNDAYSGDQGLSYDEAVAFHRWQIEQAMDAPLDYLYAGIMPALDEARGMARVMADSGLPYILSLMIDGSGRLLDGHTLHDAICTIDGKLDVRPLGYMTNCVHPSVLESALDAPCNDAGLVRTRFLGIQANAACADPKALEGCDALQTTSPQALGDAFASLVARHPLKVLGGCCGTDGGHIREIARRFGGQAH